MPKEPTTDRWRGNGNTDGLCITIAVHKAGTMVTGTAAEVLGGDPRLVQGDAVTRDDLPENTTLEIEKGKAVSVTAVTLQMRNGMLHILAAADGKKHIMLPAYIKPTDMPQVELPQSESMHPVGTSPLAVRVAATGRVSLPDRSDLLLAMHDNETGLMRNLMSGKRVTIRLPLESYVRLYDRDRQPAEKLAVTTVTLQKLGKHTYLIECTNEHRRCEVPHAPELKKALMAAEREESDAKETKKEQPKATHFEATIQVDRSVETELRTLLKNIASFAERARESAAPESRAKGAEQKKHWSALLLQLIQRLESEYRERHKEDERMIPQAKPWRTLLQPKRYDAPVDPHHPTVCASVLLSILETGTLGPSSVPSSIRDEVRTFVKRVSERLPIGGEKGTPYAQTPTKPTGAFATYLLGRYEFEHAAEDAKSSAVSGRERSVKAGLQKLTNESGNRLIMQGGFNEVLETIEKYSAKPPKQNPGEDDAKIIDHDTIGKKAIDAIRSSPLYEEASKHEKENIENKLRVAEARVKRRGKVQ